MEPSSLCPFQPAMVTAATRAAAAPFVAVRRGECFFVPPQRWRMRPARAGRWPGRARATTDPKASSSPVQGGGPPELPRSSTALRVVGAGVALAVALGGVSWAAARGRGAAAGPVPPPALVLCDVLNNNAAAGAPMKKRLVDFMDNELSVVMRSSDMLRNTDPRDREKIMVGREEHFSKTGNADEGLKLTQALILLGNWRKAEATCQKLTNLYPDDPKPRLISIVINVTQVMETLLSTDPTTTHNDKEEMANKINEMTKNAINDAWKKYRK
ncbi:hypothetical protein PAHAL_9G347000 [Panicum hallii]|uniref:Uncharacterized protein n=1 Tax=Panicum hallii TaxID=206008 RepID=A0A2T8I3I0_9POAL|nr:uncharacterized protein LOC112877502 [Panicum hallii]PVH32210.1 hypothetical protein PAHAL_9G347000 [Panicum hallii]